MRLLLALCLFCGCAQTVTGGQTDYGDGGLDPRGDGGVPMDAAPSDEDMRIRRLILSYAPVLFFHGDERHLPSSAEWFLSRAALYKDGALVSMAPTAAALPTTGDGYYLTLPVGARGGDLSSALAYVHPKRRGAVTDLQFWFFYPYNGPGTLWLSPFGLATVDVILAPFGEHTGDWEHVTLRFDDATEDLTAVYLSQHSGGEWILDPLKKMDLEGRRPIVYASKNGHAAYRAQGINLSERGSQIGLDWGLRNDAGRGTRFDSAVSYRVVRDDAAPLTFTGRWGPRIDNAAFISDVVAKVPVIGKSIAESTLAKERISDGATSPAKKSSWTGEE